MANFTLLFVLKSIIDESVEHLKLDELNLGFKRGGGISEFE